MEKTSFIKKRDEMLHEPFPECHGGKGALDWTQVLDNRQDQNKHLAFIHHNIIPPGASIGIHHHEQGEEYYYIISGKGIMTLDNEQFEVEKGDLTAVFKGGSHGLENNTSGDLSIIVIGIL